MRAIVVAIALAFSEMNPVLAGPLKDGVAAYDAGDYATALRLWRRLADQGDAAAQTMLGAMYNDGRGVPKDYVRPHMWSNLAAAGIPATDTEKRNQAVATRDAVAARMTPAQIAEAQRLAREWMPTAGK